MEDVIEMVNKNQEGREVVSGYFLEEMEAKNLLRKGQENEALRAQIAQDKREKLELQIMICVVCLILVAACIGGVHTEAMDSSLAWAVSLPVLCGTLLCCLPRTKEETEE